MQDTSLFSGWNYKSVLDSIGENKLDLKMLKVNLEKIYAINSYNELDYYDDVVHAYNWVRLATCCSLNQFIVNEKIQKFFLEQYINKAIRDLILCKKFKNKIMMSLTQQLMIEGLKVFMKFYPDFEKYPKMTSILRSTFDHQRQFYKLNYVNEFYLQIIPPTQSQVQSINSFIENLKVGDRVDILKTQLSTKRICWLPGTVKKVSSVNVYVYVDNEKVPHSFDRRSMQVVPYQTYKQQYQWRFNLKEGDNVDYQASNQKWYSTSITKIRKVSAQDTQGKPIDVIEVQLSIDEQQWISVTDAHIQKHQAITKDNFGQSSYSPSDLGIDDYNDILFDPDMTQFAIGRSDTVRSQLFLDLTTYVHKELNLFNIINDTIKNKKFGIEVITELLSFVRQIHPLFHRKFARQYLNELIKTLLEYIDQLDELKIRNFSKQRYEIVTDCLNNFLKRTKSVQERDVIIEKFQKQLILRFLFSDFLDRKLQAVSTLASLATIHRFQQKKNSSNNFNDWVRQNKIIPAIYNEKSHPELINRSAGFMRIFAQTNPKIQDLSPLLQWNQSTLKLVSQYFSCFTEQFQLAIVQKIKSRQKVENKDALQIVKKTQGCESWLLKNGGQCWVEVVKDKAKRRADIMQAFTMDFPIIFKITKNISQLHDCRFKNEFFLYANEINFLVKVLQMQNLDIKKKIQFSNLILEPINKVSDEMFQALLPYTREINDNLPPQYQEFFVKLLLKSTQKQLNIMFEENFSKPLNLKNLGEGQFNIFKNIFTMINEKANHIKKIITYKSSNSYSYKKEKVVTLEINVNPNEFLGMNQLMQIVFENKSISVAEQALQLIGYLFDNLNASIAHSAVQFRKKFLQSCLEKFYTTEDQQEKYIKIIQKLMNQSEKQGCDKEISVAAMFPAQNLRFKIVDHFNVNKRKFILVVNSNLTLYEFRGQIGRALNAYIHEMKVIHNGKELDPRLNGHVLHTLNLNEELIIDKKVSIQKITLTQMDGNLNQKTITILTSIFKEYSTLGYMSKQQCQKYHQRCVGDLPSVGESRVEKIYETYDTDKDGYLQLNDFISFYSNAAKNKQSTVWGNLEAFGVRNDLEILTNLQISYPSPQKLTRHLLFKDEKFMKKLFSLIHEENESIAKAAWQLLLRLPMYRNQLQYNLDRKYALRYWLILTEARQQYDKFSKDILKKIFKSDIETMCIGLKVALFSSELDKQIFQQIIANLAKTSNQQTLSFFNRITLDYSLQLILIALKNKQQIRQQYLKNVQKYDKLFTTGLLSANPEVRTRFCDIIWQIVEEITQDHWAIFEAMFKLVYRNFQVSDKSTLYIEYFDLFSKFMEKLRQNETHMQKLQLNERILTQSMIKQYSEHKCLEESLNSPPDEVAQGFLRIIEKLISQQNIKQLAPFVKFIFKQSLFPQSGLYKLKNSKSRKDAYNLIYQICKLKNTDNTSQGLRQLFAADFKKVYKKMSQNKQTYFSFSYYSYNQARSELGFCGIRNLGCICYMISMLQQLYMTTAFRYLTLMADDGQPQCLVKKNNKEVDDNIFHQLQNCFANLELSQRQEFNPQDLCFTFKDSDGNPTNVSIQQDAQQFLNIFFDRIETKLKGTPFEHILQNIFGGKTCSITVCSNCKGEKQRQQNFYPLSLEIKGHKTIYDSLAKYIQGQVISDYQCDFCHKKTDVTKSTCISKAPDNLIIHLQRICFDYQRFENVKINSRLEFPHELDISDYSLAKIKNRPFQSEQFQFRLKGVVIHYGSADFGHYYSYIKVSESQWIQFNDERIRQFDPRDIQLECFGGQSWRRQHQNAYLLVYERVKQQPIKLAFKDLPEKEAILNKYKLQQVIKQPQINLASSGISSIEGQSKVQIHQKQNSMEVNQQSQSETESATKQEEQNKQEQVKQKVITLIHPKKIKPYIPSNLAAKISKANEQFSFTINLSNDQFAYFIYKILSIDPPQQLKTQYLELCYECFHLKQIIEQEDNTPLCEWSAKRFRQIITGHGWEFLKNFGQNWQSDIVAFERSSRIGMRNLLQCVILDIIQSNKLNEQYQQVGTESEQYQIKRKIVFQFLEKFLEMMGEQISKYCQRWKEYFQIWDFLIDNSSFVRRYLEEKMVIEKLLTLIMEQQSTYSGCFKSFAEFECPMNMITLLIKHGYELNEYQIKQMNKHAFLNKIINYPTTNVSLVELLCKDNHVLSEKLGFTILFNISRVDRSDYVKPIIAIIHQFLAIQDNLQSKRIQWIIGIPQYLQHRSGSYGVFKMSPQQDFMIQYISPLNQTPVLQHIIRFKSKAPHIGALLISMILQLQADGIIHNLDEYPSVFAYRLIYTDWIKQFVDSYYEEYTRYHTNRYWEENAKRIKYLWLNRPNRQVRHAFRYLIGKTVEKKQIQQKLISQIIQLTQYDVQSFLAPVDEKIILNKKIVNKLANNQNFVPKATSSYLGSFGKSRHSSDDQQVLSENFVNPFQKAFSANVFKKYNFKNISEESYLITLRFSECAEPDADQSNAHLPVSEISMDVKPQSTYCLTFLKKDVEKQFGKMMVDIKILGKPTKSGFWPKQIITPMNSKPEDNQLSEDEDSGEY